MTTITADQLRKLMKPLEWRNLKDDPDIGPSIAQDMWVADGLKEQYSLTRSDDGLIHFWDVGEGDPFEDFEAAKAVVERFNQDLILEFFALEDKSE